MLSATSSTTHAAGADAAVASVVTEEAQSAQSLTRVGEQVTSCAIYNGYTSAMPLTALAPPTGGGPPSGGGGSPPVAGSIMRPPVASPAPTSTPSPAPGTQPLAYVPPEHPRPITPSQLPPLQNAEMAQVQQPQPQPRPPNNPPPPTQLLTPPRVSPPATRQDGPSASPAGAAGPGIQMLDSGAGSPPQAPQFPMPLDPLPPPFPSIDPKNMTVFEARAAYELLRGLIAQQRDRWKPEMPAPAAAQYNARNAELEAIKAALEARLRELGVTILPPGEMPPSASGEPPPGQPQPSSPQPQTQAPSSEPPAASGEPPVPQNVRDTLQQIDAGKWPGAAKAPGTKGGSKFENDQQRLPTSEPSGKPIIYTEWDVNPKVPGQKRDDVRIVTGTDGSAWYTTDHYGTFHRIR